MLEREIRLLKFVFSVLRMCYVLCLKVSFLGFRLHAFPIICMVGSFIIRIVYIYSGVSLLVSLLSINRFKI